MDSTRIGQAEPATRWKAARVRLSEAIQEFSDATSIFTHALLAPTPSDKTGFDVESILDGLDLELERLESEDNKLKEANARLKEARNASKHVVPINRLPLSVLYRIFDIIVAWADDCCEHILSPFGFVAECSHPSGWKTGITSLTSVCTAWRRFVTETPSYWSHIDARVFVGLYDWTCIPTEYSKLCLQRANNTPLQIHVYCVIKNSLPLGLSTCPFPQYFHGQTITSINLALDCPSDPAKAIIGVWRDSIPTSAVKSLRIKAVTSGMEELPVAHLPEQLHTLELMGIITDWNQIRFSGLVNLTLSPRVPLPIDQLRGILVASPVLCRLVIGGRHANEEDLTRFEGTPVELGRLASLGLGRTGIFDIILLLRMIKPAPECTALSISFSSEESNKTSYNRIWEAIQTFCIQHKVSCLALDAPSGPSGPTSFFHSRTPSPLFHLLHSLTDLHTLALWNTMLHPYESVIPPLGGSTDEYMPPPALQRLYLNRTHLTGAGLRRMVSASSIRWLRMDNCSIDNYSQELSGWLKRSIPEFHLRGEGYGPDERPSDCELPWWLG